MKIYFAGDGYEEITARHNVKTLHSYLYADGIKKQWKLGKSKIFLDSGAFTAYNKSIKINIDDYIKFIKENNDKLDCYAGLDKIGFPEETLKNCEYMEKNGLKPIPTFHYNSDLEYLKKMVLKYKYIALGGLVPIAKQKKIMQIWLDNCFKIIRNNVMVHGFGVNSLWAWERYPFFSVDATSWLQSARYGVDPILKIKRYSNIETKKFIIV